MYLNSCTAMFSIFSMRLFCFLNSQIHKLLCGVEVVCIHKLLLCFVIKNFLQQQQQLRYSAAAAVVAFVTVLVFLLYSFAKLFGCLSVCLSSVFCFVVSFFTFFAHSLCCYCCGFL